MRLFSFMMVVLIGAVLVLLANLYVSNYNLFNREVMLYGDTHMRVWAFTLVVLAVGFLINLFYNGYAALRDMVKGLNASAATRMGRRLSSRLTDARALIAHGLISKAKVMLKRCTPTILSMGTAMLCNDVMLKSGDGGRPQAFRSSVLEPGPVEARYQLAEALQPRAISMRPGRAEKIVSSAPKRRCAVCAACSCIRSQRWDEPWLHKAGLHFRAASAGEKAQR